MKLTFLRHCKTDLNGKGYIATKLDQSSNEIKRNISRLDDILMSDNDKLIYAFIKDLILSEEEAGFVATSSMKDLNYKINIQFDKT